MLSPPYLHVTVLVNLIVNHYFNNLTCLVHYYDDPTNLVKIANVPVLPIQSLENIKGKHQFRCNTFFLQCNDTTGAFEKTEEVIKSPALPGTYGIYNDRKYLIIINNKQDFVEFFSSHALNFVRDVLIIFAPDEDNEDDWIKKYPENLNVEKSLKYDLYTHKYIGFNGTNDPILLDSWYLSNSSFKYGNSLFPDKFSDQQGRELFAPCHVIEDNIYAYCDSDPPIGNNYNIILEYVQRFNFTLVTEAISVDDMGIIEVEDILVYFMTANTNYSVDILYDGYPDRPNCDSVATVTFKYEVSVPVPDFKYGYWMFIRVFKAKVWIAFISVIISIRILVYVHQKYFQQQRCRILEYRSKLGSLSVFGYIINQPSNITIDVVEYKVMKYIVMLLLALNILMVTAYNSRLASVMAAPEYEDKIDSLDDLAKSDLYLLFLDTLHTLKEDDPRETYQILYQKSVMLENRTDFVLSDELFSSGYYAVARKRLMTGEYFEEEEHKLQMYDLYTQIQPDLFHQTYYILLRQHSMHTKEIFRLVSNVNEAGLNQFWQADALRTLNETVNDRFYQENPLKKTDAILKLHHLKGIFAIWGCSLVIAFIIFLSEIIIPYL